MSSFPNSADWYGAEDILARVPWSMRTLRGRLAGVPENCRRTLSEGRGRPRIVYHYTALPELAAAHVSAREASPSDSSVLNPESRIPNPEPSSPRPTTADDLAIASLRLLAVREYQSRRRDMTAALAAEETCREWQRNPRSQTVQFEERLPGNHLRRSSKTVRVGGFSISTLRIWAAAFEAQPDMLALVPQRKGACGRGGRRIDPELLRFIYGLSVATVRMDVKAAVATAAEHWSKTPFPRCSLRTWERRLRRLDPRDAGADLQHSVNRFRNEQLPDIERDWNGLAYNEEFQVDDIQQDYYIFSTSLEQAIRPYCYAVIRCATRQLVALLTSETPIVNEQVRGLVAAALVSPHGGIPQRFRFERGQVAGDPQLDLLLTLLGCKVSRTEMDSGASWSGAAPDVAKGHAQGKAIVEANARRWHNLHAMMPAQVGPEERHSAPARTQNLLKLARQARERGEVLQIPDTAQWHAIERSMCERFNTTPHTGLPRIVDPETGDGRHMTPNEAAAVRKIEEVRVMDPRYLPLFYIKGQRLPVTQNGIRVEGVYYGRFDEDLKALESAVIHLDPAAPDIAYCADLGRCIERYEPADYHDTAGQVAAKKREEVKFRSQHEAVMQTVVANLQNGVSLVDAVYIPEDPVPARPRREIRVERLDRDLDRMTGAVRSWREARAESDRRFDFDSSDRSHAARGGGLLARAPELVEQVSALGGGEGGTP